MLSRLYVYQNTWGALFYFEDAKKVSFLSEQTANLGY